jgi:uncharacterized protein (DUF2147 family)
MTRIALAAAFIMTAGAALADPAEGVWQTVPDDNGHFGHIEIAPCGPALCGTLVRAYDVSGAEIASPNVGRQIVWGMEPRGNGEYAGGKVWSPDRDKTYNGRLTLTASGLQVEGCVLGICRDGGTWARVD